MLFGNSNFEKNVDVDGDSIPEITVRYSYDGWNSAKPSPVGNENWDVWAVLNSSNTLVDRYMHGDLVDQVFATIDESNDPYWLLTDHLVSVRDIVDDSGTVVKTVAYDGYGNIISQSGTGNLGRYAWTGREIDTETGLRYNRARYYDPTIGRWLSQDPIGFNAGDSNLYRYINNAPTMGTDPSGLAIYYCLNPNGALGFGHAGLLIGPIGKQPVVENRVYDPVTQKVVKAVTAPLVPGGVDGKYLYLSVVYDETIFKDGTWTKFLPYEGGVPMKMDAQVFDSFSSFAKSEAGRPYNYFILHPTRGKAKNDEIVSSLLKKWNNAGYRLLWKNCSNFVLDGLIDAGAIDEAPQFPGPNERGLLLRQTVMEKKSGFTHYLRTSNSDLELIMPGSERFGLLRAQIFGFQEKFVDDIKKTMGKIREVGNRSNMEIRNLFNKFKN